MDDADKQQSGAQERTGHRLARPCWVYIDRDGCRQFVYACPCCGLPTIGQPGGYEICSICHWEDDDNDGFGPNGDYSLAEAQQNFTRHRTMYRVGDGETLSAKRYDQFDISVKLLDRFKQEDDLRKRGALFEAYRVI